MKIDNTKSKKIILRTSKKPGPKPKGSGLNKGKIISFTPEHYKFLCWLDKPSGHIRELINKNSEKYQKYKRSLQLDNGH